MTKQQLYKTLLEFSKQGNCFTQEVRTILLHYKNSGGTQDTVVSILKSIKKENLNNQTIQDGADDILDIATGYCGLDMLVWK
ncbi:hypothetical protein ABW636_17335 [Aquimarina sp. 2201CG1-2-11]|uniref:hypothetical protein n=1 Tax=Aquimarina discodermiae TaxID=3231043 RepID=UPI0034636334